MYSGMSQKQKATLLTTQIMGLIEALKFRESGGKIFVAVDYSEVHSYACREYSVLLAPSNTNVNYFKEQVALSFLFEEFPRRDQYIYLLPPYRDELIEAIQSLSLSRFLDCRFLIDDTGLPKLMQDFVESETVKDLLSKAKGQITRLDNAARQEILDILKKNYLELYVALTIGTRQTLTTLKEILTSGYVKILSDPECAGFRIDDVERLKRNAEERWFDPIRKARPGVRLLNNYRDALALEYLVEINEKLTKSSTAMVLVTRSLFQKWTKMPPFEVRASGKVFKIPPVFHPIAIFTYMAFMEYKPDSTDIEYEKTIKNLTKVLNIAQNMRYSYQNIPEQDKTLSAEGLERQLIAIDDEMNSVNNLKAALRSGDKDVRQVVDELIQRIDSKGSRILQQFASRFGQLVSAIGNDEKFQDLIASNANSTLDQIDAEFNELSDRTSFENVAHRAVSTSPARLTFSDDDFRDTEVKEIIGKLREKEGNIRENFDRLLEMKKYFSVAQNDDQFCRAWEAQLLITQLKVRTRNNKWVLNDCERATKEGPDYLKPLFAFLRNVALSRDNQRFEDAVKGSEELAYKYGPVDPRYYLQQGYFTWIASRRRMPGYCLQKAREMTTKALEAAERDTKRNRTCCTLALLNLTNFSIEDGNLDEANAYLERLSKVINNKVEMPMVSFTKARVLLATLWHDVQQRNKDYDLNDLNKQMTEVYQQIRNLISRMKENGVSYFTEKMYGDLIHDVDKINELFANYKKLRDYVSRLVMPEAGKERYSREELIKIIAEDLIKIDPHLKIKSFEAGQLPEKMYREIHDDFLKAK